MDRIGSAVTAVDHVGRRRAVITPPTVGAVDGADDEIVEAVAIDVPSSGKVIAALNREAGIAEIGYVDECGESATVAEDDVGSASVQAATVAERCGDDDVRISVAVEVTSVRNAEARNISVAALDHEARARHEKRQVDRAEGPIVSEDYIGRAGVVPAAVIVRRADDDVREAVTINVTSSRDADSQVIAGTCAVNYEAVGAEVLKIDAGISILSAENDISGARVAVGVRPPNNYVVESVVIDVASV